MVTFSTSFGPTRYSWTAPLAPWPRVELTGLDHGGDEEGQEGAQARTRRVTHDVILEGRCLGGGIPGSVGEYDARLDAVVCVVELVEVRVQTEVRVAYLDAQPAADLVPEAHSGLDERVCSLVRLRADRHGLRVLVDPPESPDSQDEPLTEMVPDLDP